ncbi:MAG: rRNA maturation RNase YbeY [Egibacteraceae bacterium]
MAVFVADEQAHPVDADRLRRLGAYVLAEQQVPEAMELSLLCVDPEAIGQLNAHHMGVEEPTDVLAFPMDLPGESRPGEPSILGDVVVCPQIAAAQAPDHHTTAEAEIDLLVVHGILHVLGQDHADPEERRRMFILTDRLLDGFRALEGSSS